ncbi:uncharacterized protein GBIM_00580 [Gryllus bimaculatus]|nr:uncharacterized protein GBIM_00580 [Gryllus bimaculatus]
MYVVEDEHLLRVKIGFETFVTEWERRRNSTAVEVAFPPPEGQSRFLASARALFLTAAISRGPSKVQWLLFPLDERIMCEGHIALQRCGGGQSSRKQNGSLQRFTAPSAFLILQPVIKRVNCQYEWQAYDSPSRYASWIHYSLSERLSLVPRNGLYLNVAVSKDCIDNSNGICMLHNQLQLCGKISSDHTSRRITLTDRQRTRRDKSGWIEYACKKRWNMLRDSYRKAVRKSISARSEQNSELTTTFKFEKQMKFLLPYFAERQHNSNSTFPVNDQYDEYEGRIKEEEEEEDSFIIPSPMEPFISQEDALSPSLHSEEISRTPSQSCDPVSFIPGHSQSPHNEGNAPALSTVLRNYFESKIQKKQSDHLTKFFSAMEETTALLNVIVNPVLLSIVFLKRHMKPYLFLCLHRRETPSRILLFSDAVSHPDTASQIAPTPTLLEAVGRRQEICREFANLLNSKGSDVTLSPSFEYICAIRKFVRVVCFAMKCLSPGALFGAPLPEAYAPRVPPATLPPRPPISPFPEGASRKPTSPFPRARAARVAAGALAHCVFTGTEGGQNSFYRSRLRPLKRVAT